MQLFDRETYVSVLEYVYPGEPERLDFESVVGAVMGLDEKFLIEECERKPRANPNWSYLLFSLKSTRQVRYEFVVAQNNESNIEWVSNRHSRNRNVSVVCQAKKYIWAQLLPGGATDRVLTKGIIVHWRITCLLARISKGVVNLPENENLYTSSGFARYIARVKAEMIAFLSKANT